MGMQKTQASQPALAASPPWQLGNQDAICFSDQDSLDTPSSVDQQGDLPANGP